MKTAKNIDKKVDKKRRNDLIKNFQALAFLGCFLLPFGGKKILSSASEAGDAKKTAAIWS